MKLILQRRVILTELKFNAYLKIPIQELPFQYLYDFMDALITQQTSPAEAYRKFDELGSRHIELLRKLTKTVQEARNNHDDEQVKGAVNEYEEVLERYAELSFRQWINYCDVWVTF